MSSWHNDSNNKKVETKSPPKQPDGQYDRELIKRLFMESKFIDWTRFAESQNWDALYTRRQFPVATWQMEKRKGMAEVQADKLLGMMFDRKFKWHFDVLKTLNDYPQACDSAMFLINMKIREYAELAHEYRSAIMDDEGNPKPHPRDANGKRIKFDFEKIKPADLQRMAGALKDVTDAKHRSLLLNNWSVDMADAETVAEESAQQSKGMLFRVKGFTEELGTEDIQKIMDEYYDKPALPAPEEPPKDPDAG